MIASRVLVSTTTEYGGPTDIRITSDGQYLYAFYETNKTNSQTSHTTYLWGAKYTLDDNFSRVAYTSTPITSGRPMSEQQYGGELVDDPAPLVGSDTVFVITRLKYALSMSGQTIYRVRGFSKSNLSQLFSFDLDLSNAANGRGRVTGLLLWNSRIHIALAATVSDVGINENTDDGAKSDIILVRMHQDWTFDPQNDVYTISAEPSDVENYVCGFETDSRYFYITHKQSVGQPPAGEHRAWIKAFNQDFNFVLQEMVRSTVWGPGGGELRPSLEVRGNRIFPGQSTGESLGSGNANIYLYEMIPLSVRNLNDVVPKDFALSQNYPNPFNPTTEIRYQTSEVSHVSLKVYDILGREVKTLVNENLKPGSYGTPFDAAGLPSGVYFYRLQADKFSETKKLILLR